MSIKIISKESFGDRLKRLLKDSKMSQQKLADFIGVHRNAVNFWIKNKRMPTINNLHGISHCLNVSYNELITGEFSPDYPIKDMQSKPKNSYKNSFSPGVWIPLAILAVYLCFVAIEVMHFGGWLVLLILLSISAVLYVARRIYNYFDDHTLIICQRGLSERQIKSIKKILCEAKS